MMMGLSVFISILGLTIPWFMKSFTDNVIAVQRFERVPRYCLVFAGVIVIRYFVDMAYERLISYVAYSRITLKLRQQVEHILIHIDSRHLYKDCCAVQEKDIESILLGDVDAFRNIISQTIKFFTELLRLVLYIGVLFCYSIPVGVIVCFRIPVYYLLVLFFDRPLDAKNEEKRALMSELIQTVKQIFISLPAIKTLRVQRRVEEALGTKVERYCANQEALSVLNARYQEINTGINTVVNLAILIFCGKAILMGHMTIGTMMLISNVQSRTTMPLFFFNNYYLQYKSCFPGITRLVRFLDTSTEEATDEINKDMNKQKILFHRIELKNISYSYDDRRTVLNHISFEIRAGEKIVLTGCNATGKSTLLGILAGLIRADSGSIEVDGNPVNAMDLRKYATLFLQKQESYSYFGNTGSGGEIQLENLSLVIGSGTPLILLDEADAGINERRLGEVYHFLAEEAAVVLVTHRSTKQILAAYPDVRVIDMDTLPHLT